MVKTLKNGTWWKVLLAILGSGLTTATVIWIWQASTIVSNVQANAASVIKIEKQSDKTEEQVILNAGDIRDLKKDVTYIREGIDRIENKLPE